MSELLIKLQGVMPSEQVCVKIGEQCGGKVALAFSCGKDSIAAWLQLNRLGVAVVPYYCYIVPDLKFINEQVKYYEDFFETKIHQFPNRSLLRMLSDLTFQPPHHVAAIRQIGFRKINNERFSEAILDKFGMPDGFIGVGCRACDSARRRLSFIRTGPISHKRRNFFPVWDWTVEKVRVELFKSKVRIPKDYWMFGRSFDGLDYRFLEPLSRHYPEDYARILEWFPFAELEILRRNSAMKPKTAKTYDHPQNR